MNRLALGCVVGWLFWVAAPLNAQEEASDYFFDSHGGPVPTVVDATGTWTSRLAAGWGLGITPQGVLPGLGYGSYEKGLLFSQMPDFTLSLRMFEQYFFEVVYTGSVDTNTFEVGFDGTENDWIKWVKAGNTSFDVPSRAGAAVAPGRAGSPALGFGIDTGPASQEFVIRYEDGTRETKKYRGFVPQDLPAVALTDWIRGQFFQLTSAGPWTNLTVYLEDNSRSEGYREAGDSQAAVNPLTGEIRLAKPATGSVWASWTGQPPLVIHQPGSWAAPELADRYPLPDGLDASAVGRVVQKSDGAPLAGYSVTVEPGAHWFTVSGPQTPPFGALAPGLYPPGGLGKPPVGKGSLDWEIRFSAPAATTAKWILGADVLTSSVVVVRNGLATTDFHFEPATGAVTPDFLVSDTDDISITFQRSQESGTSADVFAWQGGQWRIGADQTLDWNTWVRWNTVADRYTTRDLEAPGQISASLLWKGKLDSKGPLGSLAWNVQTTAGALLSDSTSGRRLLPLDTPAGGVALSSESLRPAAPPGTIDTGVDLTALNRGKALFRDFTTSDPLTGEPVLSSWSATGAEAESYAAGGSTGPYLARGDGVHDKRLAVLESELAPGEWAGLQVFFDKGHSSNLSGTTEIRLPLRFPSGMPAGTKVYLQAGFLGENFDGSGVVKSIDYQSRPALSFVDAARGFTLQFPVPEDSAWTNDGEQDGVPGNGGPAVTRQITGLIDAASTDWQTLTVDLTEAEQFLLSQSTSWSVLVVNSSGPATDSVLLVESAEFQGATWAVVADASAPAGSSVTAVDTIDAKGNTSTITWSQRPVWSVEGRLPGFHPRAYRKLDWKYRFTTVSPDVSTLTLRLSDSTGQGLRVSWPLTSQADWQDVSIDLETGALTVGNTTVQAAQWTNLSGFWDRMTLSQSGADSGTLDLSPPQTAEGVWDASVAADAGVVWNWGSTTVSLRSVQSQSLLGGLSWKGTGELSTRIFGLRAEVQGSLDDAGTPHAGYTVGLPLGLPGAPPLLDWEDNFTDRNYRRENARLSLPFVGDLQGSAAANVADLSLSRDYQLQWKSPPAPADAGASLSLGAQAQASLRAPAPAAVSDWASLWTDSWQWLLPPAQTQDSTLWKASATAALATEAWDLQTEGHGQVVQLTGAPWKIAPTWGASVSLPITAGSPDSPWLLEPKASALWTATWNRSQGLTPADVAQFAWQSLVAPDNTQDSSRLDVTGTLTVTNLPFLASSQTTWTRGTDTASSYTVLQTSLKANSRLENLFGQSGQWPVFAFYRTDSFAWSVDGSSSWDSRAGDTTAQGAFALKPEVYLTTRESLGLPMKLSIKDGSTGTFELQPLWKLSGPANLPFALPGWLSPPDFERELRWETSLNIGLGWSNTKAPLLQRLETQGKLTLTLSPKSEVHFTLHMGNAWQDALYVVGLEAVLDVVLSF